MISDSKGQRAVARPTIESLDITKPLKIQQVNIGSEEKTRLAKIGDCWDDDTVGKVDELLTEYQELFPMEFSKLKGIV